MGSFAAQLEAFARESKDKADLLVREVVMGVGERAIDLSPTPEKGTHPYSTGEFVSNWNYGLETRDSHTTKALNIRTLNNLEELPSKAAGFVHFISNAVPHAPFVENMFAPVGLTALEFNQIVEGVALKVKG